MEGFKGGKFLPASRSEAPPSRASGAETEAEKFPFPFRRKKSARANQKKFGFCPKGTARRKYHLRVVIFLRE